MYTLLIVQLAVSGALMGMLSAFFSLTLIDSGLPYWLVVPGGMLFGAVLGLFVERAAVRLSLEQKGEGWLLLAIILGLLGFSAAENIWGRDDRPMPAPISYDPQHFFGIDDPPLEQSVAILVQ